MRLFDSHCHLQDERLAPHLDGVLRRAAAAGVDAMLCCGSAESDWDAVRALAAAHPAVQPAFGLHPWYVADRSPKWLDSLRRYLAEPLDPLPLSGSRGRSPSHQTEAVLNPGRASVLASREPEDPPKEEASRAIVGEIGLDHALDKSTFAAQEECFLAQVKLAAEWRCPVSLHCRRAWGRLMELLDARGWPPDGVVLHSYSGGPELVAPLVRRGAFFSFSGAITHDRNARGREAAAAVPEDRLLIETDAPDIPALLPPGAPALRGADGKPLSEPAHVLLTVRTLAALRHVSEEAIAECAWKNSVRLLGSQPRQTPDPRR